MSVKLNRLSVPTELQVDVENIALDRFPRQTITWVDENPGFIVLEIPEDDYGRDVDSYGLPVGQPELCDIAVITALEERLKSFVRAKRGI